MTAQSKTQIKAEITSSTANNLLGGTILTNIVDSYLDTSSLANPSASLGLTAINGSATTAMRSDAAPALSQSITPTWTGTHTFHANPAIVTTGAIGVGTTSPGNQVPTGVSPGSNCVDVQYSGGGGPFSLVMNGPQGTFYAMGYNAGYAWFQSIGAASSGPAWAMALNNDTTLNLFYSNNSFTGSPAITYYGFLFTPGVLARFLTSGAFASASSNTGLATYYNGGFLYLQTTDATNGNTLTYDFRDSYGHSYAAVIGQVLSQAAGANTGILAFATSNASTVATTYMVLFQTGGLYLGTVPGTDPGTGSLYVTTKAGIGTNAISSAVLALTAGTTAKSQINLAASTAPTSPNDGDFWYDGTNVKIRVGAATKTFSLT